MLLYRIAKQKFIEDLSGLGSRLYGGRWNQKGYSALYTSSSLSLCMCETLVHCDKSIIPQNMFFAELEIPDEVLPSEFTLASPDQNTESIGTQWLKEKRSVAIKVHSAILPAPYEGDFNIILNPDHPDFSLLKIKTVVGCPFDLCFFPESPSIIPPRAPKEAFFNLAGKISLDADELTSFRKDSSS